MDLGRPDGEYHFIGLALIVGTVGILDLRMLGFLKQLPMAPLHRFMPWAMAGLGANIVTGLLAFIGQPENYIYSGALWLKILALLLLGVNAAVFYLTGIFNRVNPLRAGEDPPMSARFIAVTSLLLWFAVITFGRYIQPLSNTVRLPGRRQAPTSLTVTRDRRCPPLVAEHIAFILGMERSAARRAL